MNSIYRFFLIGVGVVSAGIGILGIFLPLLPSTVFFLISAACFVRSSPRLYVALVSHPKIGPLIVNYRRYRAMPRKAKKQALILLFCTLSVSAFLVQKPVVWGILALVFFGVSAIILSTRSLEDIALNEPVEPADS